ncbi:hypothetical protein CC2G_002806 [Coprinopsis cinerea AmutBmut pab1-1]|nr:hypothetical protein CC2G_002806 [Coprinopsis cinerea AmutBmut pab1-1]
MTRFEGLMSPFLVWNINRNATGLLGDRRGVGAFDSDLQVIPYCVRLHLHLSLAMSKGHTHSECHLTNSRGQTSPVSAYKAIRLPEQVYRGRCAILNIC